MRRIAIILFSITILVCIDYFSKQYVEHLFVHSMVNSFSLIGEYLGISLSYNSGIAFSLPITGWPLQMLTVMLVFGLSLYYALREYPKHSQILDIWYILILAWAFSHMYERIWVGHVIDFIAVKYFAILNFADIFISIGACFIFYAYYVRKQ